MDVLHVALFHRFHAYFHAQSLRLEGGKIQELLAFLILFRSKSHSREALCDVLWREAPAKQSRRYLSKALWQLQSTLEATTAFDLVDVLRVESEWISLKPNAKLSVDAATMESAYKSVQGVAGHELDAGQFQLLQAAANLYQGDLLEGWYQDWCLHERQRYKYIYLAILDRLIDCCEAKGAYELGIGYAMTVLQHDQTREHTHRQVMRLLYLAGDRTSALQQYEYCHNVLRAELDVVPDMQTIELYEQIKRESLIHPRKWNPLVNHTATTQVALLLEEFQRLQADLRAVQNQIEQSIATLQSLNKHLTP